MSRHEFRCKTTATKHPKKNLYANFHLKLIHKLCIHYLRIFSLSSFRSILDLSYVGHWCCEIRFDYYTCILLKTVI